MKERDEDDESGSEVEEKRGEGEERASVVVCG